MAYLATIVWAHRNFEGHGGVVYNNAYHCQAAARKDLNWATIDTSLYNRKGKSNSQMHTLP